jgi:hypothetical protein
VNNSQHPSFPADAYPRAVYASDRHITPDTIRVEASKDALMLWVSGLMAGVPRDADDTRLQAALHLAWHLRQTAERFGAMVRAELEQRQRERTAEPIAAAMRAANHRPDPAAPATGDTTVGPTAGFCTGCGNALRPATMEELAAAASGQGPGDTRRDCPNCRVEFLAEQARSRAESTAAPSAPVALPETALMPAVEPGTANGDRPR